MERELTIDEMLERWGLRVVGGTLKSPYRISTGGEAAVDDDLFLVRYVQETEGFERAAPVLRHRYSLGLAPESFRIRRPGEPLSRALIRLGWFGFGRLPESRIPGEVLEDFRRTLADRMRTSPYQPPSAAAASA